MSDAPVDAEVRQRVRAAVEATPRAEFLPRESRHLAGADRPVLIAGETTNSQPSTVTRMLELLDPRPGDRVLDVGSGSGWTTAILSRLVTGTGRVVGVERSAELVVYARERLSVLGLDAPIELASPGVLGLPEVAPFDRILVSADLGRAPDELVAQIADGGRLVAPVAGRMTVIDVRDEQARQRRVPGLYSFVPLRED